MEEDEGSLSPPYNARNWDRRQAMLPIIAAIVSRPDVSLWDHYTIVDTADHIYNTLLSRYPE